jgi:hypothetical protein
MHQGYDRINWGPLLDLAHRLEQDANEASTLQPWVTQTLDILDSTPGPPPKTPSCGSLRVASVSTCPLPSAFVACAEVSMSAWYGS